MLKKIISCSVVLSCLACAISPIVANATHVWCNNGSYFDCKGYEGDTWIDPSYAGIGGASGIVTPKGITIECECEELGKEGQVFRITCLKQEYRNADHGDGDRTGWGLRTECTWRGTWPDSGSECLSGDMRSCENITEHYDGQQKCIDGMWRECEFVQCKSGYTRVKGKCYTEWKPEGGYGYCDYFL